MHARPEPLPYICGVHAGARLWCRGASIAGLIDTQSTAWSKCANALTKAAPACSAKRRMQAACLLPAPPAPHLGAYLKHLAPARHAQVAVLCGYVIHHCYNVLPALRRHVAEVRADAERVVLHARARDGCQAACRV